MVAFARTFPRNRRRSFLSRECSLVGKGHREAEKFRGGIGQVFPSIFFVSKSLVVAKASGIVVRKRIANRIRNSRRANRFFLSVARSVAPLSRGDSLGSFRPNDRSWPTSRFEYSCRKVAEAFGIYIHENCKTPRAAFRGSEPAKISALARTVPDSSLALCSRIVVENLSTRRPN